MKKTITVAMAMATMVAGNTNAAQKSSLKTPLDSVSYSLGINVGRTLNEQLGTLPGEPINKELFMEAVNTCLKSKDTTLLKIKPSQTPIIINSYMSKAQEEQSKKDKMKNDAYMANNAKQTGVITTKSGLQYIVLNEGNGAKPAATDKVKVNYVGRLTNGNVFDKTEGRGPAEFELNKVIPGWTEGIQLMSVGSKYRFIIPPELGYGSRPVSTIPANSILIFDVDLLDVGKKEAPQPQNNGQFNFKSYQK